MVSLLASFEQLRQSGQDAYGAFYGFVGDSPSLDLWAKTDPARAAEFRRLVQTLPPPSRQLPFRILCNIAGHAVSGELENHHSLESATGRPGGEPIRAWFLGNRDLIQDLAPETLDREVLWLKWVAPPAGPQFHAGRVSLDDVWSVASGYAAASGAAQAGPASVLLVLLRDWAEDLAPLLEALGILSLDFLEDLVAVAGSENDRTAFSLELTAADERVRNELGLPTSAWTIFAALSSTDRGLETFLPPPTAIVEAISRLAAESSEADAVQSAPDAAEGAMDAAQTADARPSTTVTTDAWTDRDQLEHQLYADAIYRFILDPRTKAPLTIGIKAPWGAGKTSLMRMIRKQLDPAVPATTDPGGEGKRLTIWEVLRKTKGATPDQAANNLEPNELFETGRRTTVWFNAWKYQSSDQLWAGLAHAILSQVSGRLTPLDRDRLWASIQVRRIRLAELRRSFYRYIALRMIPYLLVVPVAGAGVLIVWLLDSALLAEASIGGALAAAITTGSGAVRSALEEVTKSTPQLVQEPDYESRLGFLHLVDSDMRRILELAGATKERPFVVFIDDLDRCSYTTVAQVIEALNVFLAGDFENCIFIIAMEPELVAAQIHVAYEKLFDRLEDRGAAGLGWRFLEKMVQLPLALPEARRPQIERYIDSLVAVETEGEVAELDDEAPEVVAARREIRAVETTGSLEGIAAALEKVKEERARELGMEATPSVDAVLQKAARLEFVEHFSDAAARDMLVKYAFDLSGNPREIKRFVNLFRFYAYIDFWRATQGLEHPGPDGAGKLARLAIGWPDVLSAFARDVERGGELRPLLVWLEEAASSAAAWKKVVGLAPERIRPRLISHELREVMAREPHMGASGANLL